MLSRKYTILFIIFIGTVAVSYFLAIPKYKDLSESFARIEKINEDMSQTSALKKSIGDIQKILDENMKKLDFVDFVVPTGPKTEELFVIIEGLTRQNQVAVDNLSVSVKPVLAPKIRTAPITGQAQPEDVPLNINEVTMEFGSVSSYANLKKLLDSFERSRRLLDVETININIGKVQGQVEFKISAKAYYQ